jgi:hypothetical protein
MVPFSIHSEVSLNQQIAFQEKLTEIIETRDQRGHSTFTPE